MKSEIKEIVHKFRINCANQVSSTMSLPDFDKALEEALGNFLEEQQKDLSNRKLYQQGRKELIEQILKEAPEWNFTEQERVISFLKQWE